jgi:single-stranded DNA-binding protein
MGEGFYEINLKVKRLSEQYDVLPVTISERLLADARAEVGKEIGVTGQFRSYNKTDDEKSRLMLTVFVREIDGEDERTNPNIITLTGYLCKQPIYRTTPFNREIADMLLAVNRAYNKSDYIPCIAWGRNARFVKNMSVGEKITVSGRIQSREYQKNIDGVIVSKTAYEVSVNKIFIGGREPLYDGKDDAREALYENRDSGREVSYGGKYGESEASYEGKANERERSYGGKYGEKYGEREVSYKNGSGEGELSYEGKDGERELSYGGKYGGEASYGSESGERKSLYGSGDSESEVSYERGDSESEVSYASGGGEVKSSYESKDGEPSYEGKDDAQNEESGESENGEYKVNYN